MEWEGGKLETDKKCVIRLWNLWPQDIAECKNLEKFKEGLGDSMENKNIQSCSGKH